MKQTPEFIMCFESVSRAIMAEQALLEVAFDVRVMPLPAEIKAGCGFCLRVLPEDFERAAALLAEQGIPFTEAYRREGPGFSGAYQRVDIKKE